MINTVPAPEFWQTVHPYPDLKPRSITEPMPLGVRQSPGHTGAPAAVRLRDTSLTVAGKRGSGKTVLIADVVAGALQCTDCLVWTAGGYTALPFLRSFHAGAVGRPCIDWVATTIDEITRMARTAVEIATDRRIAYQDLMHAHNTFSLPVGNGLPGQPPPFILIVVDDTELHLDDGSAAGQNAIADLTRAAQLGGAGGVGVVTSRLRGSSRDDDDGALALMRPTDPGQMLVFGSDYVNDPAIPNSGGGYLRETPGGGPAPFMAFYQTPVDLAEVGARTTDWRPVMDERSRHIGGDAYQGRWARTGTHLWENPRPDLNSMT